MVKKTLFIVLAVLAFLSSSSLVLALDRTMDSDFCGEYKEVSYMETIKNDGTVTRKYYDIPGEGVILGSKVWKNSVLIRDTVGTSCLNDL